MVVIDPILNTLIENKYRQLKDQIIIINKSNEGLPAARRTGMEYATGDYILHIDSDDWLEVDAVEKIESVDWLDLGMPEAMWNLKVKDFGPLIVAMDSKGNSLYD